jgi:hypothetical protein
VSADANRTGHEPWRVADYRRERDSWQVPTAAANHWLKVDMGAGVTKSVDYLFIDRGHNLWGATVVLQGSTDNFVGSIVTVNTFVVPAVGTLGGVPGNANLAVTEEGALYALLTATTAYRYWRLLVSTNMTPIVTGLQVGTRFQLLGFPASYDEDAAERTEQSSVSPAGYRGVDTTYSWRVLDLALALIGATEYDASIRRIRDLLFDHNEPLVIVMDYGTRPERAWMYQVDGRSWALPKKRTYREGRIRFREVGPSMA